MKPPVEQWTILPDTSVWIDHLVRPDAEMVALLTAGDALLHPFVIGEIALGNLRNRKQMLWFLSRVDEAKTAMDHEVLQLIENKALGGSGIGYVDAHLLASCLLTDKCLLWTRDKRLGAVAARLGIAYNYP